MTDEEAVQEAEDLDQMLTTKGWKWLENYITDMANAYTRKLVSTPDGLESTTLKAQILALTTVIRDPKSFVLAAREAKIEKQDQTPQEQS